MSPLPRKDQLGTYALKGLHLGLRQAKLAPEQMVARQLRRQAMALGPRTGKRIAILTHATGPPTSNGRRSSARRCVSEARETTFITCGGGLEQCDRVNVYEGPPMPCATCSRYVDGSVDAHGFPRLRIREGWAVDDPGDWPGPGRHVARRIVRRGVRGEFRSANWSASPFGGFCWPRGSRMIRWLRLPRVASCGRPAVWCVDFGAALDDIQPEIVLLLNGRFFFESIANAICRSRGIDVVIYERGFILDTLIFHRRRPDLLLDVADDRPEWDQNPLGPEESR